MTYSDTDGEGFFIAGFKVPDLLDLTRTFVFITLRLTS